MVITIVEIIQMNRTVQSLVASTNMYVQIAKDVWKMTGFVMGTMIVEIILMKRIALL